MRTVGIEEELLLLDPSSGVPVARAAGVLAGVETADDGARAGGSVEAECRVVREPEEALASYDELAALVEI